MLVGAVQLRSTEPFPELLALNPVGAGAKPLGTTVAVRERPATLPAPIACTRKVYATPFVRLFTVQLNTPFAGIVASVVQETPSVELETT